MTNISLTTAQKLKLAELRVIADRALHNLPERARDMLITSIIETPSGQDHVFGDLAAPSPDTLIAELWATPRGRDLGEILEAHKAERVLEDSAELKLAQIMKIQNPAARIAAAREAGLA